MKLSISSFIVAALPSATLVVAQSNDTAAIRTLVQNETQAYCAADANAWRNCWANVAEARALSYGAMTSKVSQSVMPANAAAIIAGRKPVGVKIDTTNEQIRLNRNTAFVQYNQHLTHDDGAGNFSYRTRYPENRSGVWKIIHVGSVSIKYVPPLK
ncbi:hypothetical protein ACFSUS_09925 [Spirosoma soli]|uniref:SnoaL-like domain-containing protein n=1 Tax=Spirosoma soli TaxID=1770529 RepID=A0ABW5M4B9_9BACT